nr:TerB N-terminal domain-containing protein [Cupriavidus sp. LEh25]
MSASAQGKVKSSSSSISAAVDEDLVHASYHNLESSKSFRIPPAPAQFGHARWLSSTENVEIAGVAISGGLIYVGTALKAASGIVDPCLIDPSKDVAKRADYTVREMGYWPSYSAISPTARRAYLNWLSTGRADPDADIGYVFIYFYGLERRAVFEAVNDQTAKADLPAIAAELRRLLAIYGPRSGSFQGYGTALLDWITLANLPDRSYLQPLPSSPRSYELPLYIRAALGQAAADRVAISADLALAWVKLDPRSLLRTPTLRCAQEFNSLFKLKYLAALGDGLVLPRNRTKLKLVYRAASAGFRGVDEPRLTFGDIPDVSVLAAPFKKLHEIAEAATNELESLSRYLGRNPGARSTVEALLLLPVTLWPESAKGSIEGLKERMDGGMVTMPFHELLGALGNSSTLSRERTVALARVLEGMGIGMEPDVLGGAKQPKPEDQIALFVTATDDLKSRDAPDYRLAALALQLAAAVATSDGDFGANEISHLHQQIQSWSHLSRNNQRRLVAHLRLLMVAPPSLTALKKKLESLDPTARGSIASFVAAVAQSDGTVSPVEVRMLEKVYKVLGVDPQKVFSELHSAATGSEPATKHALGEVKEAGFTLDASRIAVLQKDSEGVSAMLSTIFVEETEVVDVAPLVNAAPAVEQDRVLGLDEAHSSLARLLLSRPRWTKAELSDAALDLDLMLDGALEQLNDAAFDAHDMAFFEGDDLVEINLELREKLAA